MRPGEVYWAASDIGWVVGHSYIVYAPLLHGCTTVLYEGKPVGTPDAGAFWRVCADHRVSVMFTAPTAIRAIKRDDPSAEHMGGHDLSAFRMLFLGRRALRSGHAGVGAGQPRRPVIDHWWQTESGWPMAANCVGLELLPVKPGSPTKPVPATTSASSMTKAPNCQPARTARSACGSRFRRAVRPTLWRGDERFVDAYLSTYPGYYLTGDAGYFDEDGYLYVMSRIDDVINVAGHRLSTGQMEEVLASHPDIAECAVVGVADEFKGQIPIGFAVLKAGVDRSARRRRRRAGGARSRARRSGRLIQDGGDRRCAAEDPIREDAARHDPQDRRRRALERAADDRGRHSAGRLRRTSAKARIRKSPNPSGITRPTRLHSPADPLATTFPAPTQQTGPAAA